MKISHVFSFSIVLLIRSFSKLFYRIEVSWITPKDQIEWENLRVLTMLNHTSLFEPLYVSAVSPYRLWRAVRRTVIPIADVTMKRPVVGFFFRLIIPNIVSITRKRDDTWSEFLSKIGGDSLVAIFPEGRMMRAGGLDKHGKPMTVKGGISDILTTIDSGKMLIAYSGGLHHVQAPGQTIPKVFKTIRVAFEQVDISEYKLNVTKAGSEDIKSAIVQDLETRMKLNTPKV